MVSLCREAASLPRSTRSSARSRNSRAFFCANSRPSSAFSAKNFRVSSPDFGANNTPTSAPTPSPTKKYEILDPTLSAISASNVQRNTAICLPQYILTGTAVLKRLCASWHLAQFFQHLFRPRPRKHFAQPFQSRPLYVCHAAKLFQQL